MRAAASNGRSIQAIAMQAKLRRRGPGDYVPPTLTGDVRTNMDDLDFIPEPTPEVEPVQAVEAAPEVTETPTEQVEAPAPVVVPEPKPEPGHVPLTALMDERDKRKALEARLAEYERTQAQPSPDPDSDPTGYQQHQMQVMQQALLDTRLNMSEVAARRHYGAEATDAAKQWALERMGQSPAFRAEVLNNPDPYDYAIQTYQREQIASQVTADDFQAFQAWKSAQAQVAAAPSAAPTPSAPVPRSIASTPSAGGVAHVPLDDESVFGSAIP